jgi:hypothetical protein
MYIYSYIYTYIFTHAVPDMPMIKRRLQPTTLSSSILKLSKILNLYGYIYMCIYIYIYINIHIYEVPYGI